MKHILFIGALLIASTFSSFAQQTKSIVGKWKFSKVLVEGMTIDVDNPEATKKELAKQIEAESGQKADPAMLDQIMEGMMSGFKNATIEFTTGGKVIWTGGMAESNSETATYVADGRTGTITTVSDKDKKKETIKYKFSGNDLVLDMKDPTGKSVVITLKKK